MSNCLVLQGGEPTAVMNASLVGIIQSCQKYNHFERVYGGVNGLEGIIRKKFINLFDYNDKQLERLKNTPAAALGVSHYNLKEYKEDEEEYINIVRILKEYDIEAIIVIGNSLAIDIVNKLSLYFQEKSLAINVIGIPSDYKNEIFNTHHSPGFGSAAKYIATIIEEIALDSKVYSENGVYIVETMGHETGWLAASSAVAKINNEYLVDLIYFPEMNFLERKFIDDVSGIYSEKRSVIIVVAEGLKDLTGQMVGTYTNPQNKNYIIEDYSGAGRYLKKIIIENEISTNVKVIELGITQRSSMHCVSQVDINEAYALGIEAVNYVIENYSGLMVGIQKTGNEAYETVFTGFEAKISAKAIKHFPAEWIDMGANFVTDEAIKYIEPLIKGITETENETGLPEYIELKKEKV